MITKNGRDRITLPLHMSIIDDTNSIKYVVLQGVPNINCDPHLIGQKGHQKWTLDKNRGI